MNLYVAAVILAMLIITAIAGICYLISLKKPEHREKMQGSRRNVAVRKGVPVDHQENGYFLKSMRQRNTVHMEVTERGRMWNLMLREEGTGRMLFHGYFSGELLVGRGKDGRRRKAVCDHPEVSKEHCRIFEYENHLYLEDRNAKNHTYLNGKLVTKTERLRDGDILSLGNVRVQVFFVH